VVFGATPAVVYVYYSTVTSNTASGTTADTTGPAWENAYPTGPSASNLRDDLACAREVAYALARQRAECRARSRQAILATRRWGNNFGIFRTGELTASPPPGALAWRVRALGKRPGS
jgi:hypothetical protein